MIWIVVIASVCVGCFLILASFFMWLDNHPPKAPYHPEEKGTLTIYDVLENDRLGSWK